MVNFNAHSIEIKPIASINSNLITSYDLYIEIQTLSIISGKKIEINEQRNIISKIIDEKIKEFETKNINIERDKDQIERRYNSVINKLPTEIPHIEEIKSNIKQKIVNSVKWNTLILGTFRNKLEINSKEVDEMMKNQNIDNKNIEEIIISQKNKKLNAISKKYFNELKRKYYIKYF
jgi:hypothetical protein